MPKRYLEQIINGLYSDTIATRLRVDFSESPSVILASSQNSNGGIATKTADYILTSLDAIILANTALAGFTVTLADATLSLAKQYIVKKIDASANVVTIATVNSQTIDGALTAVISTQYHSITMVSDGNNWQII